MPRVCTVCTHPKREAIDRGLVGGESNRVIARQYAVSHDAVQRHRKAHLPAVLTKAVEAREAAHADGLLDRLEALNRDTLEILHEARAEGRKGRSVALMAIARVERQIELQARLLGELRDGATVNVLVASPEWTGLQARIFVALAGFPEARTAVQAAINGRPSSTEQPPSLSSPRALPAGAAASPRRVATPKKGAP